MRKLQMVDLGAQYRKIKNDIDNYINNEIMKRENWQEMSSSLQEEITRVFSKGVNGILIEHDSMSGYNPC